MSPNIARPLTLRTSPSDYATFNQIKYFCYLISGCFWKEKTSKKISLYAFTAELEWILENVVKNFLIVISNDPDFKLFILNQLLVEVN